MLFREPCFSTTDPTDSFCQCDSRIRLCRAFACNYDENGWMERNRTTTLYDGSIVTLNKTRQSSEATLAQQTWHPQCWFSFASLAAVCSLIMTNEFVTSRRQWPLRLHLSEWRPAKRRKNYGEVYIIQLLKPSRVCNKLKLQHCRREQCRLGSYARDENVFKMER